mmetsp:Transcript_13789/g.44183  ORF Transcript_13789/g.44183 Transcript_13789/m.44183 type:complete len:162 (-) Transcript_13789:265-750(-)
MAYFSFTQAILAGKQLTEYRNTDGTELQRDFTFVTDIVSGVCASMRLEAPLEVFNLGNTRPEKVSTLISLIESGLGVKANITQAPISAGDVPMTFADVSHATELLGYRPKVSLEQGIAKFLAWYASYYKIELPQNGGRGRGHKGEKPRGFKFANRRGRERD